MLYIFFLERFQEVVCVTPWEKVWEWLHMHGIMFSMLPWDLQEKTHKACDHIRLIYQDSSEVKHLVMRGFIQTWCSSLRAYHDTLLIHTWHWVAHHPLSFTVSVVLNNNKRIQENSSPLLQIARYERWYSASMFLTWGLSCAVYVHEFLCESGFIITLLYYVTVLQQFKSFALR